MTEIHYFRIVNHYDNKNDEIRNSLLLMLPAINFLGKIREEESSGEKIDTNPMNYFRESFRETKLSKLMSSRKTVT